MDLIRRDPRVRLEVDRLIEVAESTTACRWGGVFESVIAAGSARVVELAEEKERALSRLMEKYSGRDDWEMPTASVEAVAVVEITLSRLTGKATPQT